MILCSLSWRRTFDDGFPNLFISNAHGIRGQHVAFLASFSSPGVIFEQLSIIYALPRMFISSFTLVLPFFPTGSSERMEEEGDIATAFTLARILSNIPISRGGPTSLVIFDIHALQVGVKILIRFHIFTYFLVIFSDLWLKHLTCTVTDFFFPPSFLSFSPTLMGCRKDSTLVRTFYHALRVGCHCSKVGFSSFLILIM